ncbi:MAG TPA: helix-turn-helix domain-containing protein [Myxococcota bacterium]|nr:helix-turn-helix domain-containing protein [Myxococcota bacterium]
MAQFYSLEEAARVLGLSPEDLKSKAQHREIRAFLDGGSWRFRVVDIDELARRRGLGSEAEPRLSDSDVSADSGGETVDHLDLSEFQLGVARPDLGNESKDQRTFSSKGTEHSPTESGSDHEILFDDLSVPPNPLAGASSVIIGMQSGGRFPTDSDILVVPEISPGASDSDVRMAPDLDEETSGSDVRQVPDLGKGTSGSDVRVVPDLGKGTSGSDVRLVPDLGKGTSGSDVRPVSDLGKGTSSSDVRLVALDSDAIPTPPYLRLRQVSDSDVTLIKDDLADHSLLAPLAGVEDTAFHSSPIIGSSAEVQAARPGSESDFELNPSTDLIDVLQPESGSDFELSALDGSDEFESTPRRPGDSDVTAADPNLSGINLSHPSDSGINLQTATEGAFELEHHDSVELAPLSDHEVKAVKPSKTSPPAKAKPSMSATPPLAVKKGEKDIFDESDFEVDLPISDEDSSEDKTLQLDAASDFELEESDDKSEVFAIDEEKVDQNAATAMSPSAFTEDEDEDDGFEEAVSSEMTTAWASGENQTSVAGAPDMVISREVVPEWGSVWVGLLSFTTLFLLFAAFIALDLLRNLYDFRDTPLASGLVRTIAGIFGY